jgi:hypothetical protein
VYGIDGTNGSIEWTYLVDGSSVWAVEQIDDITADGIHDVIVGDFSYTTGSIYGLDATNGNEEYFGNGYGSITHFERLGDVNGDGHPDIIPAHFGLSARVIDGQTGNQVWSTPLVDKCAVVAASDDLNDDGVGDVVVGTLFTNNYAYFLDGANGAVLDSIDYGTPVDAITAIPDIVGDGYWEMVVGGRNGLVTCYSGGIGADCNGNGVPDWQDIAECEGDPACSDCNDNGLPDECDTMAGGDFDADGDVDLDDYPGFAACLGGPLTLPSPPVPACVQACLDAFDFDLDDDVDLEDFLLLQVAIARP